MTIAAPQSTTLAATLKNLPDRPGVYLMKDARGNVLYVGKAQSLRSRVRSYWQKESGGYEHHLIRSVIDRVADVESDDSVFEAGRSGAARPRGNANRRDRYAAVMRSGTAPA